MAQLKVTLDLELVEGATPDQVDEILGAVMAQLEDDEPGALKSFAMRADYPGWRGPAG